MKLIKELERVKFPSKKRVGDHLEEGGFSIRRSLLLECKCSAFSLITFIESCDTRPSEDMLFECPYCKAHNSTADNYTCDNYTCDNHKIVSASIPDVLMSMEGEISNGTDGDFKNSVSILSKGFALCVDTMQKSRDEAL